MAELKIKYGGQYRNAIGEIVTIAQEHERTGFWPVRGCPFVDHTGISYTESGIPGPTWHSKYRLVEEITATSESDEISPVIEEIEKPPVIHTGRTYLARNGRRVRTVNRVRDVPGFTFQSKDLTLYTNEGKVSTDPTKDPWDLIKEADTISSRDLRLVRSPGSGVFIHSDYRVPAHVDVVELDVDERGESLLIRVRLRGPKINVATEIVTVSED